LEGSEAANPGLTPVPPTNPAQVSPSRGDSISDFWFAHYRPTGTELDDRISVPLEQFEQ
jgi:hypothetical protein